MGAQGDVAEAEPRCRYRVLPAKPLAPSLDMRQEVMETLLSYLEVRLDVGLQKSVAWAHIVGSSGNRTAGHERASAGCTGLC